MNLPFGGSDRAGAATTSGTVQLVERDVEAPEVFQVTDRGLWDGRPSLGGVWVAHPDVGDPERVIIRNDSNDSFVIGALFRRERANPGPVLQVSSDAASALGMLAGQPVSLNVTALRREEAPETPADAAPGTAAPAQIEQSELDDVGALAEAALDRAAIARETSAAPPPAPVPSTPAAPPASSTLDRPYIQIGIFSIEANANGAGDMMRREGMVPTIREGASQGAAYWRVVVGPARTGAERETLLNKVKGLGFTDAYAVRQ